MSASFPPSGYVPHGLLINGKPVIDQFAKPVPPLPGLKFTANECGDYWIATDIQYPKGWQS